MLPPRNPLSRPTHIWVPAFSFRLILIFSRKRIAKIRVTMLMISPSTCGREILEPVGPDRELLPPRPPSACLPGPIECSLPRLEHQPRVDQQHDQVEGRYRLSGRQEQRNSGIAVRDPAKPAKDWTRMPTQAMAVNSRTSFMPCSGLRSSSLPRRHWPGISATRARSPRRTSPPASSSRSLLHAEEE